MRWADELLPDSVSFIGGHPMAGKETSGIDAADPAMFVGSTYCLTPSPKATPSSVELMCQLVTAIGAEPLFIDAWVHDSLVAAISHLPLVISVALVRATMGSQSWREMSRLAASGYRDLTRLASGSPDMHAAICRTNADNIARWLDAYVAELVKIRDLIQKGESDLDEVLRKAKADRDSWLVGDAHGHGSADTIPSLAQRMEQTFFGSGRLFRGRKS